mmetsp:Transcript_96340/g.311065  ORF Transcript_96340/g.311065 Transcript_96340/m.311065 type:complete len:207 (-) Transcript_96340:1145-1765(-)
MIFTAFLFAPTVPSPASPKNTHCVVDSGTAVSSCCDIGNDVKVTSSSIPTVKRSFCNPIAFSKTDTAIAGVYSFEPRPYRPPNNVTPPKRASSCIVAATSKNRGSRCDPCSLVRSSTVTVWTDGGKYSKSLSLGHGRNKRGLNTPTLAPFPCMCSTTDSVTFTALPICTMTCSGSGSPEYLKSDRGRPVTSPTCCMTSSTIAGTAS